MAVDLTLWIALGTFLLIGMAVYERTGHRLGGIIVLPLLLVYTLEATEALFIFAAAAAAAFAVGTIVHRGTLIYGRRILVVFLLAGMAAAAPLVIASPAMGTSPMFALLPGLFAYNVHREGDYARSTSAFMLWFAGLLTVTIVLTALAGSRSITTGSGSDPFGPLYGLASPALDHLSQALAPIAGQLEIVGRSLQNALAPVVDMLGRALGLGVHWLAEGPVGETAAVLHARYLADAGSFTAAATEATRGGAVE